MKNTLFTAALLCSLLTNAQERGNAAYEANAAAYGNYGYNPHNYTYVYARNPNLYLPNDSVFTLTTRVMINVQPDAYVAVFCVQQEGLTVSATTKAINDRIEKFKSGLKSNGIKDEDLFVDLIAQTKIYDYKIEGKTATELSKGFEIKKNIIIKFTDHSLLETIMLLASEQEIYDIIKVDYLIYDTEKLQQQLREAAMEQIEKKKKFATENSSLVLTDKGIISVENFNTVYPGEAYRQYTAAESAHVSHTYYNSEAWIKEQRKSKTFYFEKLNPAQFDKILNPGMTKIPVQMTLELVVKHYIGNPQKRVRK